MKLFESILASRGLISEAERERFLNPDYDLTRHDPFLLPDMKLAVGRLKLAHKNKERIVIYGDYDIDGLSATTLLLDAFSKFGFEDVDAFIPNRFVEGYGMTKGAIDKVKKMGAELIVTVDCGSLNHEEIAYATSLGIDTIVTDHHSVAETPPPAIATVNPKFENHKYPFRDLCGAGVAFKLVQAMQTEFDGLPAGYEKWLLDLVALGTVCDIVELKDENRANVFWGLEVMKKQHRTGLKALMAVSATDPEKLNSRSLGFGLGPRMNATGRLETAQLALDMLVAEDGLEALEMAEKLEELNVKRRGIQDEIFKEASEQAEEFADDPVLVVSSAGWNQGVIGIVASKLVEKFKKPTFIISENGDEATGSARSFGSFLASDAVRAAEKVILRGGGHAAAAGVTLEVGRLADFREIVNQFYKDLGLNPEIEARSLLPKEDVVVSDFSEITEELVESLAKMEPFGNGNPEPVIKIDSAKVSAVRRMGRDGQHVKLSLKDEEGKIIQMLAFNAPEEFSREVGDQVSAWFTPNVNEWNGYRSVEGRLLHTEDQSIT